MYQNNLKILKKYWVELKKKLNFFKRIFKIQYKNK